MTDQNAAPLKPLVPKPGSISGLCISRAANEQIRGKLSLAFADLGEQTVKNLSRAIGVFGLPASEIAALPVPEFQAAPTSPAAAAPQQAPEPHEIRFCQAPDGVQLA